MLDGTEIGRVFIREGTILPSGVSFETESYSLGWRVVKGLNGYAVNRRVHDSGWTFFYLAGESRTTAFGREGSETVRKAIKKILARTEFAHFNSLEITDIASKTFLGMPYARVCFHSRNLQKDMLLLGSQNARAQDPTFVAA